MTEPIPDLNRYAATSKTTGVVRLRLAPQVKSYPLTDQMTRKTDAQQNLFQEAGK